MKVLLLSHLFPNDYNPVSGIFVAEQARRLRARCEIRVVSPVPWGPPLAPIGRRGRYRSIPRQAIVGQLNVSHPRYFAVPGNRAIMARTFPAAAKKTARRLYSDFPFDLIHAHTLFPDGLAAVLLGKELGKPVVITAHGSDTYSLPGRSRSMGRLCGRAVVEADRLIAVTPFLSGHLKQLGAIDRQIVVVPNGADEELFFPRDKTDCRRRLGLPLDGPAVVCACSLVPVKGLNYLLASMRLLGKRLPGIKLYVVGGGPLRASLAALIKDLDLESHVHLVGPRPHNELPLWFGAADLATLASLSEGLPTVLVEALLCGRPIAATEVGGIPDLVRGTQSGYLAPIKNPEALAAAVTRTLRETWDDKAIAERARSLYSLTDAADQVFALYRKVLDDG